MKIKRNTVAKSKIWQLITNSPFALTHAEIEEKLEGICNKVTIYRVLESLIEDQVVHKIIHADRIMRFAACHSCSSIHHHQHFFCVKCKSVTCLDSGVPHFKLPAGFIVEEVNLTLTGVCGCCV